MDEYNVTQLPWYWDQPGWRRQLTEQYGPGAYEAWLRDQGVSEDFIAAHQGPSPPQYVKTPAYQQKIADNQAFLRRAGMMNALEERRVRRDYILPQDLLSAEISLRRQMQDLDQANPYYSPNVARASFRGGL